MARARADVEGGAVETAGRRVGLVLVGLALSSAGCFSHHARRTYDSQPVPPLAKSVVRTAETYLTESGVRHSAPRDCSDFVDRVFAANGLHLPRTSTEMVRLGTAIRSSQDLRMGDLVFFSGERAGRSIGHVGIYVRSGVFIHLSRPEVGVTMESLYSDYYRRRYLTARRVIP